MWIYLSIWGLVGLIQTGYKYALNNGYDLAVQVDGDGQHDPQFLEEMAEYLVENKLVWLLDLDL